MMTTTAPHRPCLYAIYDLGCAPVTFDIMNFFAFAHIWSQRAGFSGYHVIIVMGEDGGFRRLTPKDLALPYDEKIWRLWHVLMPLAGIARNCIGVSFLRDRVELAQLMRAIHPMQIIPPDYTLDKPNQLIMLSQVLRLDPTAEEMDVFAPTASALERVGGWLARRAPGNRPVTITLRTSRAEPHRNSRLDQWLAAARAIRERGYDPIIVPDTDVVTGGYDLTIFGDLPVYAIGSIDLDLRLAIFRRAALNMADNGGPAFLSYFMGGSTMLCFLPVEKLPSVVGPGGAGRMAELLGVEEGGSFPHATPLRRFVWRPDRLDVILEEFDKAAGALDAQAADGGKT